MKMLLLVIILILPSCSSFPNQPQSQESTARPEVRLKDSTVDKVDASVKQESNQQAGSSGEASKIDKIVTETYNGLTAEELLYLVLTLLGFGLLLGIIIPQPKIIKLLF